MTAKSSIAPPHAFRGTLRYRLRRSICTFAGTSRVGAGRTGARILILPSGLTLRYHPRHGG